MSSYIYSNANRSYAVPESTFGVPAIITSANRFPAFRVHARQVYHAVQRRDKTGGRTLLTSSSPVRSEASFDVETYLVSSPDPATNAYGALFQAACGGAPSISGSLSVANARGLQIQTAAAHSLAVGSAVSFSGEIRFVTAVPDAQTIFLNAPFSSALSAGAACDPAVTYRLGTNLPSLSIYDYWDPVTAVSRILTGAVVDLLSISIDGPYHEFSFSGTASDLIDSANVGAGGSITSFPVEPPVAPLNYAVVPGNLGQLWIGTPASQFFTVTDGSVRLKNNIELRNREYGSLTPRAFTCGRRDILTRLSLLATDEAQTVPLYAAAKARAPLSLILQLGNQRGQLLAVYLPNMVPAVPVYDDTRPRLSWEFENNTALGNANDELYLALA